MIVDIGGFSTEIVSAGAPSKPSPTSLPLGLLTLNQASLDGREAEPLILEQLEKLAALAAETVICVGLSAVFLAKIIRQIPKYQPARIHGLRISRQELLRFQQQAAEGDPNCLMRWSVERQSLPFLSLSARFYTLLLDKFGASEFIVCHYGISSGYNLWKKRKR